MTSIRCLSLLAGFLLHSASLFAAPSISTTSPLPQASLGTPYSQTLTATGGAGTYAWTVSAGALPAGISLDAAGLLSGTPLATGVFNFTAQVTDAALETATKAFTLTVYLAISANGLGIPHPSSTTTYPVQDGANTIQVPENMVYVPGGTFTYGTGTTATTRSIDGYCLNRFEVTNAEYKAFLDATGSTQYPSYWTGGTYPAGKGNHCLLYISLTRANAYAAWVGQQTGRIVVVPSAAEWERAARGPSAWLYPWGNAFGATYSGGVLTAKSNYNGNVSAYYLTNFGSSPATYDNANSTHYNQTVTVGTIAAYDASDVATPFSVSASGGVTGYVNHTTYTGFIYTDVFSAVNNAGGFTMPVGSYPTGVNAYGSHDLAGNAYEWTTTTFIASNGAEAGQLVNQVRGGGWYSNGSSGRTVDIGEGRAATGAFNSVGFRIAMLPVPAVSNLAITTASALPSGSSGTAYTQTLTADGGSGFFAWSLASGSLPVGLTLSSAGGLSGTPSGAGTANFVLRVTDAATSTITKAFSLAINATPLAITSTSPLPGGVLNAAYAQTLAVTGGVAPNTWTRAAGGLPAGVTLNTAGVLNGAPTATGAFDFTVQVTDSAGASATKAFELTVAPFGPLHHFSWNYLPGSATANAPFAARLTARDAAENLVTTFDGAANLSAGVGSGLSSPVVVTEVTPASENQIELQNATNAAVNTAGWFLRIGDSTTNSDAGMNTPNATTYSLPASLSAGQLLRITESSTNTTGGRVYFGSAIGWVNTPGNRRGWVAIFDNNSVLRDFYAFGWTAANLANFSITVNSQSTTLAGQWSGAGTTSSGSVAAQTYDSFQRTGASDNQSTADWAWRHNADNTDATSLGATNTGLTLPWASGTPLTITPASAGFTAGEFLGYLTIPMAATGATLTAADSSSHTGTSANFNVLAPPADSDGDGLPDAWETANGLNAAVSDGALDSDGDGMSNLDEFRAGTNPQNPTSKLVIIAADAPLAGQLRFTWTAIAGKIYRVSTSVDLAIWEPVSQLFLATATGPQTITLDADGAPALFVEVAIAP